MLTIGAMALMLLFAPDPQTVTDEVFEVPSKDWRYVAITLKQVPVSVRCDFDVISETGSVRVGLVNDEGLDDLKQGGREPQVAGAYAPHGTFRHVVRVPDDYFVVLKNSGPGVARVRVALSLDFSERGQPQARTLPLETRLAVIAISATVFLAIVTYSARKLLNVMRS